MGINNNQFRVHNNQFSFIENAMRLSIFSQAKAIPAGQSTKRKLQIEIFKIFDKMLSLISSSYRDRKVTMIKDIKNMSKESNIRKEVALFPQELKLKVEAFISQKFPQDLKTSPGPTLDDQKKASPSKNNEKTDNNQRNDKASSNKTASLLKIPKTPDNIVIQGKFDKTLNTVNKNHINNVIFVTSKTSIINNEITGEDIKAQFITNGCISKLETGKFEANNFVEGTKVEIGKIENGKFEKDQLHGEGTRTYRNNTDILDKGEFISGTKTYQDSTFQVYQVEEGNFENGKLHGLGIRKDGNGTVTEKGEFKDGIIFKGRGSIFPEKFESLTDCIYFTYVGEVKDGTVNGKGNLTGKKQQGDSCILSGNFIDNKFISGTKTYQDSTFQVYQVEEGDFENGKLHGLGIRKDRNGKVINEGEFKDGIIFKGRGSIFPEKFESLTDCTYFTYVGEVKDGTVNGKGDLTGKKQQGDSCILSGNFIDNKFISGTKTYQDSTSRVYQVEEGDFENGKLHGLGIRKDGNGTVIEKGEFKDGIMVLKD